MSRRLRLATVAVFASASAVGSFGPLLAGWGWLIPVLLTILVVVGASELVRVSRLPSALGPFVATAAAVGFTTAWFAGAQAVGHVIPGADARARLAALLHQGAAVTHQYAAPVPVRPGIVLLAVIGAATLALVVDLCVLTLEQPVLAIPPLLAGYVAAALLTHHGLGWQVFVLLAMAVLVLLATDAAESRRRWGRQFAAGADRNPGGMGRAVAGTVLGIATIVPVLLPGLHNLTGSGTGPGGGGSAVVTVNPLVSLNTELHRDSNQVVLRYQSSARAPSYLRLTALDDFDGREFTPVELRGATSEPLTAPSMLTGPPSPRDVRTVIHVGPLLEHWAPVPLDPTRVYLGDQWLFDPATQSVWSTSQDTQGLTYTVFSRRAQPDADQLRTVSFAELHGLAASPPLHTDVALDLNYPGVIPPRVYALAASLKRRTPYGTAMAIQRHLLSPPFSYSLSVPPSDSVTALTDFLFRTHVGYCQQYAAAMTVLARIDGIPARVAVGFTPGTEHGGQWTVTGADAHSWPELLLGRFGWLPFEPTPRGDGQVVIPSYARPGQPGSAPARHHHHNAQRPQQHPDAGSTSAPKRDLLPTHQAAAPAATRSGGAPVWLAAVLIVVLAAALPAAGRLVSRRRHTHAHGPAAAAHAAWAEVRDTVVDLGFDWPHGRSPRQAARRLLERVPALHPVRGALERIALAEQEARYAPTVGVEVGAGLRRDVEQVREVLRSVAGRRRRVRAAVLPRSTVRALQDQMVIRPPRLPRRPSGPGRGQSGSGRWHRSAGVSG